MKLIALFLIACVCQTCYCKSIQLPETISEDVDVEQTVKEVEDLIKSDSRLPRLTRGEILDIIENLTKSDADKESNRDQKAIMYVMPYSPDSAQNGDVQALYTKPPVTHLVGDQEVSRDDISHLKKNTEGNYVVAEQDTSATKNVNVNVNQGKQSTNRVKQPSQTQNEQSHGFEKSPNNQRFNVGVSSQTYLAESGSEKNTFEHQDITKHINGRKPGQDQVEAFKTRFNEELASRRKPQKQNQIEPTEKRRLRTTTTSPNRLISAKPQTDELPLRKQTRRPEIVTQTPAVPPQRSTTVRSYRRRTTTMPSMKFSNHKYPDEEVVTPKVQMVTFMTKKAVAGGAEVVTPKIQTAKPFRIVKPQKTTASDEIVTPLIQTARPFKPLANQGINIIDPPKFIQSGDYSDVNVKQLQDVAAKLKPFISGHNAFKETHLTTLQTGLNKQKTPEGFTKLPERLPSLQFLQDSKASEGLTHFKLPQDPTTTSTKFQQSDSEFMNTQQTAKLPEGFKMPTVSGSYQLPQRQNLPTPQVIPSNMQLPEDFKDVLKNLDVLLKKDPTYLQHDSVLDIINAEKKTSTTSAPVEKTTAKFQAIANELTPDMKELLMNFGLIENPNKVVNKEVAPAALEPSLEISPSSYTSFKPLPNTFSSSNDEGMDDFLAKFGLGNKSTRKEKSISTKSQINKLDAVPDDLKNVLKDIGISYEDIKDLNKNSSPNLKDVTVSEKTGQASESSQETKKTQHVFNPSDETLFATESEINKLNKLATIIKQLKELKGTATDEDLKHIDLEGLKELVTSLNVPLDQQTQLNPFDFDFDKGLDKNEVKRQQNTTTTTTTEKPNESRNPSLEALEDSFGGSSSVVEAPSSTTAEPPKKTGFYYLVDWNTFFDIDDQNGKRVNLRFQPTIGDPKRFFSVNVP